MDGDSIIYAEFDKNWYKIWNTIVCEITSWFFRFACFFIRKIDQLTNRAIIFFQFCFAHLKKTYSPVCQPVLSNKTSKSKNPGLYFTNNGVLSQYIIHLSNVKKTWNANTRITNRDLTSVHLLFIALLLLNLKRKIKKIIQSAKIKVSTMNPRSQTFNVLVAAGLAFLFLFVFYVFFNSSEGSSSPLTLRSLMPTAVPEEKGECPPKMICRTKSLNELLGILKSSLFKSNKILRQ